VLEARRVIFIGDGAGWIRRLKEAYFPQALGVLDVWHLERELKRAFGEEKKDVVEVFKVLALEGKGRDILQRLLVEGTKVKEAEQRKRIVEAMSYVKNNLDWIANIVRVKGYGTGPVEVPILFSKAEAFKVQWRMGYLLE
jgi:hypothetical protein